MYVLAQDEIKKITARLANAEVQDRSLAIDLVDHICCMIEERVEKGMDLMIAEEEVFKEMGAVQLKAIEIETKKLTQNKIIMKKRTKIIGIIGLALILTGFIFKMLHLWGAGVIWGLGILTTGLVFFLFLVMDRFNYAKTSFLRTNLIVGYLGSALFVLGSGLKLLHLPGAFYMGLAGGILLLLYFLLSNLKQNHAEAQQ